MWRPSPVRRLIFCDSVRIAANAFFVATVDAHEVETGGFSAFEETFVLGHRWWTREELRSTADTVYPEGLADLLDGLGV